MLVSLTLAATVAACVPGSPDLGLESFAAAVQRARAHLAADGAARPGQSARQGGLRLPDRPVGGQSLQGWSDRDSARALDAQPLWGRPLPGGWLAFRRDGEATCAYATLRPDIDGFAPVRTQYGDTLWAGLLPSNITPANTSVSWAGRRWAGIVLPVPRDSGASVRLLIHELVHTLQPRGGDTAGTFMPLPLAHEGGDGSDQLEGAEGRALLRLELRALAAALAASGDSRRSAARDALHFRYARYARASAAERQRQRGLDVGEGLPEYTAWMLASEEDGARAGVVRALLAADRRAEDTTGTMSFTRSFPYLTGPAYALLLDDLSPGWRVRVLREGAAADLQRTLAEVVDPGTRGAAADSAATAAYGGDAIASFETARWRRLEALRRAVRERYLTGPTLRLRPGALRISFDPNGQTSLGAEGTVMRGVVWKGAGGAELLAPQGALVTADWAELRLPLDPATARQLEQGSAGAITLQGEGWSLRLPAGWRLERTDTNWVVRPDRAR